MYVRPVAKRHVKGDVSMVDIEAEVKRKFRIDMKGGMAALQEPMNKSREIYRAKRTMLEALSGFSDLLEFTQLLPKDAVQASDDFDTVYAQASEAQAVLLKAVAEHWESDPDPKLSFLKHAVKGTTTAEWIEMADSPGVKGSKRAKEKMANDYGGHANKLKDLARLTLRFTQPDKLVTALRELKSLGFKTVILKNKYANPTPMGYCDFNLVVTVKLADGTEYLCEMQLNLQQMLDAKEEAHNHYEVIRTKLPELCKASGVDTEMAGKLEEFIMGRLNNSALEAAVDALSSKAQGLFLYAHLLEKHLESEAAAGREINFANLDALPAGLSEVYETNFRRTFREGGAHGTWQQAKPLVELILASTQPLTVEMAEVLLNWDDAQKTNVLEHTALLFPERGGVFHVFHKSVSDWLTGEVDAGAARAADFAIDRKEPHVCFEAQCANMARGGRAAEDAWRLRVMAVLVRVGLPDEWLQTAVVAARGVEAAAARLVAPLAAADALTVGRRVLAHDPYGNWQSGQVVRAGDTIDVTFGGNKSEGLAPTKALVVASDGAGALLRAAAGAGHTALVESLLSVGVRCLVADARANTPLHVAAGAGHVRVCQSLQAVGADWTINNVQMQSGCKAPATSWEENSSAR